REIRRITQWRREHQPGGTFNAGSVFKNPAGDAAGKIIDDEGLKGMQRGGVRVSARHANFFEADAGASAQNLYDLVWAVRRAVGERTGVWLEPEVRFAGEFERSPDEVVVP
ncbi:MAG: UDP-N-acetylenolpyruvoylglucosamine reductase, partial [Acidimicrobiia bacterium]|nr:UDP-N-acetylenolpyruvoylglucosamine reductase [Acidimicrobiia bacterium]